MANLTRSFQPVRALQREIDRLFGEFVPMFGEEDSAPGVWAPTVDVNETASEYIIKMDLPGIAKEDVNVTLEDRQILISGQRKEETRQEGENRVVVERRSGSFYRSFTLPQAASDEGVEAEMKDGVLSIRVKKSQGSPGRRVEIR